MGSSGDSSFVLGLLQAVQLPIIITGGARPIMVQYHGLVVYSAIIRFVTGGSSIPQDPDLLSQLNSS